MQNSPSLYDKLMSFDDLCSIVKRRGIAFSTRVHTVPNEGKSFARLHADSQLRELCFSSFLNISQVHQYSGKSIPLVIVLNNTVCVILVACDSLLVNQILISLYNMNLFCTQRISSNLEEDGRLLPYLRRCLIKEATLF